MVKMVETWKVLWDLGYRAYRDTDGQVYMRMEFGTQSLKAIRAMDRSMSPSLLFMGNWNGARSAAQVEFFVPETLPTREHVLAALALNLRPYLDGLVDQEDVPTWIAQGYAHLSLLG